MKHLKAQKGFTLIEVMIALAIVSIALAGLTKSLGDTALNQAQLESRIIATWVAEDELVKQHVLSGVSSEGNSSSEQATTITQLGREWRIDSRSESTTFPGITKLLMIVTDQNDDDASVELVTVVAE